MRLLLVGCGLSFKLLYEFCTLLGPAGVPDVSPALSCVVMLRASRMISMRRNFLDFKRHGIKCHGLFQPTVPALFLGGSDKSQENLQSE
jgi:hypothetical protein